MPTQITIDDDAQILVELKGGRGVVDVARDDEKELTQKSAEAFNSAMATIHSLTKRTASTIRSFKVVSNYSAIAVSSLGYDPT